LETVRDPDVRDAGRSDRPADRGADPSAGDAVLDPERPYAGIGMCQREPISGLGVGEVCRVKIDTQTLGLCPVDPALEVGRLKRVSLDARAAGLGVTRVQVNPMSARDQGKGLLQVRAQLVGVARAPRIPPGHGEAAADLLTGVLEARDV